MPRRSGPTPKGASRNYGFVTFETEEAAAAALKEINSGKFHLLTDPVIAELSSASPATRTSSSSTSSASVSSSSSNGRSSGSGRTRGGNRGNSGGSPSSSSPRGSPSSPTVSAGDSPSEQKNSASSASSSSSRRIFTVSRPQGDFTQISQVTCVPDPGTGHADPAALITIAEDLQGRGRMYNRAATPVEATNRQTVQFTPRRGEGINANVTLHDKTLKIMSIEVVAEPEDIRVAVNMGNVATNRTGQAYIRRVKDENGNFVVKRKYFDMVNGRAQRPEDEKNNTAESASTDGAASSSDAAGTTGSGSSRQPALFDIDFVAIDSITLDPNTGVWTELRLALDSCVAPHPPSRGGQRSGSGSGRRRHD